MPSAANPRTRRHYHPIGITFHWLMALFVFAQLALGFIATNTAPGYEKLSLYGAHAVLGLIIFALAFLRAGWRLLAPFVLPDLEKPEDLPEWQRIAAEVTHFFLYALMFALPLSGWLMLSAANPRAIAAPFGLILPALPTPLNFAARARLEQAAEITHLTLVWILMALVAIHVAAALKHYFWDKDDVLTRMIPWLKPLSPQQIGVKAQESAPARPFQTG